MNKQNILIVDDDETIIEILQKTLDDNGYTYTPANDGKEALNILQSNTSIDGIILDILMPGMDGRETLKNIKENNETKDIPVLMLTGENAISDVSECLTLGANDYMVKPFDTGTLLSRLQGILPSSDD